MRADIKQLGVCGSNDSQIGLGSLVIDHLTADLYQQQEMKSEFCSALVAALQPLETSGDLPDSSRIQLFDQRRQQLEEIFISRIRYDTIKERELTIKYAYKGAFRWIFDTNSPTSFQD
ncbi:hypothetical protein ACHAPU_007020 [Fusarium lateritium]